MATDHQTGLARDVTFFDHYKAPIPAGSYRFVLQQTVKVGDEERHYYRDQAFEVLAPRYSIEADEIQAYFPPPGGVAGYHNILPHLVLCARNLPWERGVSTETGSEPWLALLVLSDQELQDGQAVVKTGNIGDLAPVDPRAAQWSRTEGGAAILLPKFTRTEDLHTPVRLFDIDLGLFLRLCPRWEELPLLAHIRHVDTTDKIPLAMVADGEFSVLVANRFPSSGANTVHLISLEGWKDLIDANQSHPASRVRLITLASWSFVSDPAGHDTFGGLMARLKGNAGVFGVALPAPTGDAYIDQALTRGYVPLDYQPLESTPAFAWYRGPLSPIPRQRLKQPPFQRADAALIFDERTGIMDISYSAAWQLGRLLAVASPAFSKGLRLFVERCQNASELASQIETFLELHRSAFDSLTPGPQPAAEMVAIANELVEWVARLVMLYPVPFHYLVPHPALLPPESLRFFDLDDNWVDALVDGALSIAVRSLSGQDVASRNDLQSSLSKIVYQHRLRLKGKRPEWEPTSRYMETPKSGFLLRSSIVTGWPGVEVTAETEHIPDPNIPAILRLDQISDGVLFCLANGSLKQVTFREPREGITFGVDSEGAIRTRESGASFNVREKLLRTGSGNGVVDISALRGELAKSERIPEPGVGSAEFARQLVRMPEEHIIKWV